MKNLEEKVRSEYLFFVCILKFYLFYCSLIMLLDFGILRVLFSVWFLRFENVTTILRSRMPTFLGFLKLLDFIALIFYLWNFSFFLLFEFLKKWES